jgi:hypothetical protein
MNEESMYKRSWIMSSGLSKDDRTHKKRAKVVPNTISFFNLWDPKYDGQDRYRVAGSTANFLNVGKKSPITNDLFKKPKQELYTLARGNKTSKPFTRPTGFDMIWNTGQWEDRDWSEQYVAVYRIICEPGYVALGHVTLASNKQYSYVRPESMFERNACVKEEFTTWDSNPNRIYVDFDGWEPLGRNWALTRNKMMSVW